MFEPEQWLRNYTQVHKLFINQRMFTLVEKKVHDVHVHVYKLLIADF